MNLRSIVTVIAVLIGLGMIIFPPWTEFYTDASGAYQQRYPGYHFLWDKPADIAGFETQGVRLWSSRISAQLLVLFGLTLLGRKLARRGDG